MIRGLTDDGEFEMEVSASLVLLVFGMFLAVIAWAMGILKPALATGFTLLVVGDAYLTVRDGETGWGDIRWFHYAAAVPLIATVLTVRWACLHIGWMQFAPLGALLGSPVTEQNINLAPVDYVWLALPFLVALFVQIPRLAAWEESKFREGLRSWPHAVLWSVLFGYVHCLVGVSLATAAGLSVGGLYLSAMYFCGGVRASTAAHAAMNAVVLLPVLLLVTLVTVAGIVQSLLLAAAAW